MKLSQLFKNAPEIEIEQLSSDSRMPMRNAIFFCLDGIKYDGHNFIEEAINNGAKAIVYSDDIDKVGNAIYIKVKNVNETLNKVADIFYNHPTLGIDKYLVSGCYGRSSVSRIIEYYLNTVSSCGSVGVFGINYKDRHLDINFPALTPLENYKVLDNLKKNGIKNVVFESSVISLYYHKLDAINPNVFIYTNTSRYSSDYKVCNNYYFENLRKYLYSLEDNTCVLFNEDDETYIELKECVNNYYTYGQKEDCDYRISNISIYKNRINFNLTHDDETYSIESKLLNLCNVYNLTAAIAALNIQGHEITNIIQVLENIDYVPGVVEPIDDEYNIIIDCGYEIDSVKQLTEYAKSTFNGRTIGLIAINYNDNEQHIKNLLQILQDNLDVIILTEDESLQGEVMSILSKADKYTNTKKVLHMPYRSIAIENAINILNKNDVLLIMGKGNENYLSMGLGKERYLGDKHYALKYLNIRKENENETI